ncbi:hypothetical protein BOW53_00270 [Solemya pervernicosa gill symbiont]|uniref:FecR protein domain-containing protein n=2 Tax=Gammaproteobacteria incertae sedis TaxID=118884 RepID=A0A1T2LB37_9GAMM|nr:FecR family protein [Candidatus Reidiella endopervernicosa]OOZ42315.1 hypothetical protein BOW53_00270 [Solemya pervernicosa gill symbiont]QKQ25710.1 FecR domain-containing protein [Candidatus Reidiella endopervernicosa]
MNAIDRRWRCTQRQLLLCCALLLLLLPYQTLIAADEVGTVTLSEGAAELIRGTAVYQLEPGVMVEQDDIIETAAGARVQLEMVDQTLLDIGESSTLHLVRYQIGTDQRLEAADVSLLKGWLRFVTGLIQPERTVNYSTPFINLGIKGTQGVISVADGEQDVLLEEGEVEVDLIDQQALHRRAGRLRAGEHFELSRGFTRFHQRLQVRFGSRLPKHYKQKTVRHLKKLKKRKIKAKKLRAAGYNDIKWLLASRPELRKKFIKRFSERLKDPTFRRAVRNNLNKHPEWRDRLIEKRNKQKKQKKKKRINRDSCDGLRRRHLINSEMPLIKRMALMMRTKVCGVRLVWI